MTERTWASVLFCPDSTLRLTKNATADRAAHVELARRAVGDSPKLAEITVRNGRLDVTRVCALHTVRQDQREE